MRPTGRGQRIPRLVRAICKRRANRWCETQKSGVALKEEVNMYLTDIVWWGYTAFVVALALFRLFFAYKVREKGD